MADDLGGFNSNSFLPIFHPAHWQKSIIYCQLVCFCRKIEEVIQISPDFLRRMQKIPMLLNNVVEGVWLVAIKTLLLPFCEFVFFATDLCLHAILEKFDACPGWPIFEDIMGKLLLFRFRHNG